MVGLQYFATFLHVAKLPGVAQLSAADSALPVTLGQVWILWEPAIGSSRPRLCNYKIHNYTFAILQNTANGFFAPTLKMSWYLSILSSDRTEHLSGCLNLSDIVSCGGVMRLGNEPSWAETITSLPTPGSVFCCFPEQRTAAFVIKPPPLSRHSAQWWPNVVWFTCGWISCCADKIFILMAWPLTYFGAGIPEPEPVRRNNLLRSLRTRIQRAGAERPGLGCSPHTAGLYPGSLHAAGKKWRWSPVRLWHLLGSAHFLLAPVFVPGEVLVAPGLAWPQRLTCKPPWPRLPSLLSLIPHLTHHYPSKPSSISHFLFDILKLSMLKCYHLFSVKVSFSPYATNGDNLSQKCKKWYIDWRTKYVFGHCV